VQSPECDYQSFGICRIAAAPGSRDGVRDKAGPRRLGTGPMTSLVICRVTSSSKPSSRALDRDCVATIEGNADEHYSQRAAEHHHEQRC
jgi:hypothetical protein